MKFSQGKMNPMSVSSLDNRLRIGRFRPPFLVPRVLRHMAVGRVDGTFQEQQPVAIVFYHRYASFSIARFESEVQWDAP